MQVYDDYNIDNNNNGNTNNHFVSVSMDFASSIVAYINILRRRPVQWCHHLKLHRDSDKVKLERGARQGDNISPRLFTSCL